MRIPNWLSIGGWLLLSCCITLAYFFLAKFGLTWSDFTSGITLVWPAAGLAIFCCLRFGWRAVPAIFFGSLISTQLLHFNKLFTFEAKYLLLAACMAAADTLQAFLIARVNRALHLRSFNVSILRLIPFVASVFIGCLLSATVGTFILHSLDIVTADELKKSWLFWWMGDSAGMLLFSPLLFWIFVREMRHNNPKASAFLLLSSVTGIVIFVIANIGYIEDKRIQQQNHLAGDRFTMALDNRLELSLRDLDVLNRFYYKIHPTEKDFADVSKPLLERSPWINQLIWLPVKSIKNQSAGDHWAISINSNKNTTESTIGLIQLIGNKTDNRQIFVGNLDNSKPHEFYLFHPVRDCISSQQKNCYFRGWVIARVNLGEWFAYGLQQIDENSADNILQMEYQNQITSWQFTNNQWINKPLEKYRSRLLLETEWKFIDQAFNINLYSSVNNPFLISWTQSIAFIFCLVVIGLLIAYLHAQQKHDDLVTGNQRKLKKEIDLQTRSLREANNSLLREVSERKSAQELLQKSQEELHQREQHLRSLLDNIPDPVWLKNREGLYISCNQAFATFMGKSEADIIGKDELQLVSPEIANNFKSSDEKALQTKGQTHRYEQWLLAADGSHHLLDTVKLGIKNIDGEVVGVLGIARDISEKHQLITALQIARDKAEEATQSKSRFLANMSHEIRTPLNAVLGYAQLLIRDKGINSNQQQKLSSILTSGHKLLDLINDILDLSKIESGEINIKQNFFDLHQEIATVQTVVADRAQNKNLPLIINITLPQPFVVSGDRQKLGQILINLLSNAIKFTQEGHINLDVFSNTKGVEFIVTDTGSGIAEKELAELFVAFKQGVAGEHAGGTGLGLTLSRYLAEAMGGSLHLQSELGKGTKAILRLPFKQEAVQLNKQFMDKNYSLRLQKIPNVLVVEDDPASNDILVNLLKDIGCQVESAFNGREGLHKAQGKIFDLIFTDIRMPDLNGLEMFKQIRQIPHYKQTPIIAVSASSLEHERDYYLAQGFQHFIGKPYSFDDIYESLITFANAQMIEQDKDAKTETREINVAVDWVALTPDLKKLLAYAAQGDMSNCKSLVTKIGYERIGNQAWQQLNNAIKHYDLEQIEKLVKGWMGQ